jgi:hypothetical protein
MLFDTQPPKLLSRPLPEHDPSICGHGRFTNEAIEHRR